MLKVHGTARDENMPAYGQVHAPYSVLRTHGITAEGYGVVRYW